MARTVTPKPSPEGTPCIECGEKIYTNDDYIYAKVSKSGSGIYAYKGYNFIHKECYKKICKHGIK
jgi:hypothetical protein